MIAKIFGSLKEYKRVGGLRIITKQLPHTKRVRVAIVVGVGAAHDPPGYEGLAHLLEHTVFSGTLRRTSDEIELAMKKYCLDWNGMTGRLFSIYYAEAVYTRLRAICDLLLDVYLNPVFPPDRVEIEKRVIIENELAADADDDLYSAHSALWKMLWTTNPLRLDVCGKPQTVKAIGYDTLSTHHSKFYTPANTTLIVVGRFKRQALLESINSFFPCSVLEKEPKRKLWDDESQILPLKSEKIILSNRSLSTLVYGCKIPAKLDEETICKLDLLKTLLSFLLKQKIRTEGGRAYFTECDVHGNPALGYYLYFYVECEPQSIKEVKKLVMQVASSEPLAMEQFIVAKQILQDRIEVVLETPEAWQNLILEKIIDEGHEISLLNNYTRRYGKLLKRIGRGEVLALRKTILMPERLACVRVGPDTTKED
jgi:predicted Zn-dependent peptidase